MLKFNSKNFGVPQSLGIIMDGNRRFAKEIMKKPWKGHKYGVAKAREVLDWCHELGIKYITIYALSLENINSRPKIELKKIFNYFEKEIDALMTGDHVVHRTETKVRFIGRKKALPQRLRERMEDVEKETKNYKNHLLNIAVAYGGQQEIIDACREISIKVSEGLLKTSQIDETLFKESLYTDGFRYPDLIIRTGGEKRLSNFLLWQAAYSELNFTDIKWPEFSKEDFLNIIGNYRKRERRFGK